jgi:hypothetical protein
MAGYRMRDCVNPKVTIAIRVSAALKAELCAEAWEENLPLTQYVAGLLTRRGKWARTVGAPQYDLVTPARGRT